MSNFETIMWAITTVVVVVGGKINYSSYRVVFIEK